MKQDKGVRTKIAVALAIFAAGAFSKYPPAEPGALGGEPLKAAIGGATRPQ